jgi:hypothetical protein
VFITFLYENLAYSFIWAALVALPAVPYALGLQRQTSVVIFGIIAAVLLLTGTMTATVLDPRLETPNADYRAIFVAIVAAGLSSQILESTENSRTRSGKFWLAAATFVCTFAMATVGTSLLLTGDSGLAGHTRAFPDAMGVTLWAVLLMCGAVHFSRRENQDVPAITSEGKDADAPAFDRASIVKRLPDAPQLSDNFRKKQGTTPRATWHVTRPPKR